MQNFFNTSITKSSFITIKHPRYILKNKTNDIINDKNIPQSNNFIHMENNVSMIIDKINCPQWMGCIEELVLKFVSIYKIKNIRTRGC